MTLTFMLTTITLTLVGCASGGSRSGESSSADDDFKGALHYASFRGTKKDGTLVWEYKTFMTFEGVTEGVSYSLGYMDEPDPRLILHPIRETRTTKIPGTGVSINNAFSMSIPTVGFSRLVRTEPDGSKIARLESHFANWWTSTGESMTRMDGTTTTRLELRNKAGELMLNYAMDARPATDEERRRLVERMKAAREFKQTPGEEMEFSLQRSKSSYPDVMSPGR